MKLVFTDYAADAEIPALPYLKNRKLLKYLNRETMAAIVALGRLKATVALPAEIPCYYATGLLEYEDYGLAAIVAASRDAAGQFSPERFVRDGIAAVSPLNQFKVLQNMPLSFASINYGLRGDNAVLYATAGALLRQALCAPGADPVLIGAGKAYRDGRVESAFAVAERAELADSSWLHSEAEGVELFRHWVQGGAG